MDYQNNNFNSLLRLWHEKVSHDYRMLDQYIHLHIQHTCTCTAIIEIRFMDRRAIPMIAFPQVRTIYSCVTCESVRCIRS